MKDELFDILIFEFISFFFFIVRTLIIFDNFPN